MKSVRFVIVSSPRSGSSLLVETLHQHPAIYCHGEIFHEIVQWHIRPEFLEKYGIKEREENAAQFVYSLLDFSNGRAAVGFKMWMDQERTACMALLADPEVKKVILERHNKLALYASDQLAKKTGVWNVSASVSVDQLRSKNKAEFSRKKFLQYLSYQLSLFEGYTQNAIGDVLTVSYEDIAKLRFGPILEFLRVELIPLQAAKQRLYSADIIGRFEDKYSDEIRDVLAEIDKTDWAIEDL